MSAPLVPINLGFAEFVAKLLAETLDAVITSQLSQEERVRSLVESAALDEEDFAAVALDEAQIDVALVGLLPDGKGGHRVEPGARVPKELLEAFGVSLPANRKTLNGKAVRALREGVRRLLARQKLAALRAAAKRGVPQVAVEGGTLRAKLTFSAVETAAPADDGGGDNGAVEGGDEVSDDQEPRISEPASRIHFRRASASPVLADRRDPAAVARVAVHQSDLVAGIANTIQDVRLRVQPAGAEQPGGGTRTADVYGEVEIQFRTVL